MDILEERGKRRSFFFGNDTPQLTHSFATGWQVVFSAGVMGEEHIALTGELGLDYLL
jgi:hypothetical protein